MNPVDSSKKLQLARQCVAAGNYAAALKFYAPLFRQFPQSGGEYGSAAALAGDYDLANRIWEKYRGFEPGNIPLLTRLAAEYQNIGLHAPARNLFAEIARLEPRKLEAQLQFASLLARTGGVEEARAALDKCLQLDAANQTARYLAAHLDRRENKLAAAEEKFRALIAAGLRDPSLGCSCHSELANILDRTERFAEAMAQLEQGKILARQAFNQEAERKTFYARHQREIQGIIALPKNILSAWAKSFPPGSRSTIAPLAFLSGSARSGTTLLERILDAHPLVAAVDEAPAFKAIHSEMNVAAAVIPAQRLNQWRQRHQKNLRLASGQPADGKLLLDKNPSRTVWLPAMLRTFPELRVVVALRDPRDVMISLYFQDHARTNYLTLAQLAEHYCGVMAVWLAVRAWEGLAFVETRYEDTVANLEKEGGRVTQFLGLAWHENQARFFEKNREKPVMSTNYSDVTRPVYRRSVGRWQAYEKQLASVLPELESYCKEFGYA